MPCSTSLSSQLVLLKPRISVSSQHQGNHLFFFFYCGLEQEIGTTSLYLYNYFII